MNLATYPRWVIPNHLEVCVRTGRRGAHASENPVRPGTDLCAPCHARFPRIVQDLVELWRPLQAAHLRRPTSKDRTNFQRNAGGGEIRDVSAAWNPAAAYAIAEVTEYTRRLMRTVLHDRRFYDHEVLGFLDDHSTPIDVALAQLALHHARWLTEYPTNGPAWLGEALHLREITRRALDAPPQRFITIRGKYCDEVLEEIGIGEVKCYAQMVAVIPADAGWTIDAGPATIMCSANPGHARIESHDWILT